MTRRARWKFVLGVVAAGLIVLVGSALGIRAAADRRWDAMKAEVFRILREEHARPTARPVLHGTAVPGNAWDEYDSGLGVTKRMHPDDRFTLGNYYLWDRFIRRDEILPGRRSVEPLLRKYAAALAHLRAGALRSDAWSHARDDDGDQVRFIQAEWIANLIHLAVVQARYLADDGRGREAALMLLDLGQFSRDGSHAATVRPDSDWYGALGVFVEELRPLILSGRLAPADLLEVERALETLEGSFRDRLPSEATDLMEFGFGFLDAEDLHAAIQDESNGEDRARTWSTWRFGFSERLMVADAFFEGLAAVRQCQALKSAAWRDIEKFTDERDDAMWRSPNPVVRIHLFRALDWSPSMRKYLPHLRLLRVAAHYRATGEWLELDDPFGAKLRREENGCRWKLWSIGPDGVDDRGEGVWVVHIGRVQDIVLEIER